MKPERTQPPIVLSGRFVPGGQAATALVYFAYWRTGNRALVPYSADGPNVGLEHPTTDLIEDLNQAMKAAL